MKKIHKMNAVNFLQPTDFAVILGSAMAWIVVRHLNNDVFFSWSSVTEYRHWVFFPAGFKLVLAMVFGWRGCLGVMLGIWSYLQGDLAELSMLRIGALALALGFAPLVAVLLFSKLFGIRRPWYGIQGYHLPILALLSALLCAMSFNGLLVAFGIEMRDGVVARAATMAIGDFIGAFLLLVLIVAARAIYVRLR